MESKITIDIDGDGKPQLRIDYKQTEDLRDRLIGRFLMKMGIPFDYNGFWAYCRLGHEHNGDMVVFVEPMDRDILDLHLPEIGNVVKGLQKKTQKPTMLGLINEAAVYLEQGNQSEVKRILSLIDQMRQQP